MPAYPATRAGRHKENDEYHDYLADARIALRVGQTVGQGRRRLAEPVYADGAGGEAGAGDRF